MTRNERMNSSTSGDNIHISQRIEEQDLLELKTFEYTEYKSQDLDYDIDPDNNFFSAINNNCYYYTDELYNRSIKADGKFSIIHFNSRSMYANFSLIKEYLHQFSQPFSIVAISETWINNVKGADFELEGYEFNYINRQNKIGGGVAIYVDRALKFKVMESMTTVMDNILECITVEICREKQKNVIVSCIYRAPDSSIEVFNDWIEEMFSKMSHKTVFICGDFNIDLLNPNKHKMTDNFINTMYSMALFPKITRPSRITSHGATLIDNIFTNNINDNSVSGLLINDISDHLPVFTVYETNIGNNKPENTKLFRRLRSDESMNAFKNDLLAQNWDDIYRLQDINSAYEEFLRIFTSLYNKNCPIIRCSKKVKYSVCPWITRSLQNACKKKNTLYRQFIKLNTKEAEDRKNI